MSSSSSSPSSPTSSSSSSSLDIWDPSFRLRPKDDERFLPRDVESVVKVVMEKRLKKVKFDDVKCKQLAMEVGTEIKEKIKDLNIPRYKVVVQVVIGEVSGQGAYIASRCLWDIDTDNYASFAMKNSSMFCVVMVFGLYLE